MAAIQTNNNNNNNNEKLYSALSPTTAGAQRAYKKIQSEQQSSQNQKTHSHTKISLEHYTYESFTTAACMPPHTSNNSTHARTHARTNAHTHTHTHTHTLTHKVKMGAAV